MVLRVVLLGSSLSFLFATLGTFPTRSRESGAPRARRHVLGVHALTAFAVRRIHHLPTPLSRRAAVAPAGDVRARAGVLRANRARRARTPPRRRAQRPRVLRASLRPSLSRRRRKRRRFFRDGRRVCRERSPSREIRRRRAAFEPGQLERGRGDLRPRRAHGRDRDRHGAAQPRASARVVRGKRLQALPAAEQNAFGHRAPGLRPRARQARARGGARRTARIARVERAMMCGFERASIGARAGEARESRDEKEDERDPFHEIPISVSGATAGPGNSRSRALEKVSACARDDFVAVPPDALRRAPEPGRRDVGLRRQSRGLHVQGGEEARGAWTCGRPPLEPRAEASALDRDAHASAACARTEMSILTNADLAKTRPPSRVARALLTRCVSSSLLSPRAMFANATGFIHVLDGVRREQVRRRC